MGGVRICAVGGFPHVAEVRALRCPAGVGAGVLILGGVGPYATAMVECGVGGAGVHAQRDGDRIGGEVASPRLGHSELVDAELASAGVARPQAVKCGWQGLVLRPGSVGRVPEFGEFGVVHISRWYATTVPE